MSNNLIHMLDIPVTNLTNRIAELRDDLYTRQNASASFIKNIEWEKSQLDAEMNSFRGYHVTINTTPFVLKKIELEQFINQEKINCQRDLFMIKEKIRYAQEKLRTEESKKKLVHGRSQRTS